MIRRPASGRGSASRLVGPAALLFAASLALPAHAQVVPPSKVLPDQPPAPPTPSVSAPSAQAAYQTVPLKNRCGQKDAAITLLGHVDVVQDRETFALAGVMERSAGKTIERYVRTEMAAEQRILDIGDDQEKMKAELARIQAQSDARVTALGSPQNVIASLHRQQRDIDAVPAALRAGKIILVSHDGSFRCEGMTPGHFEVFAVVYHNELVVRPSQLVGTNELRTELYSGTVDIPVPPKNRRIAVSAGALHLIGDIDPNR